MTSKASKAKTTTKAAPAKDETLAGDATPDFLNKDVSSGGHAKGTPVELRALQCIHYNTEGRKRVAMPGVKDPKKDNCELFSVEGAAGSVKNYIEPTTAKQEAERLVRAGVAEYVK